jgi:hypothetical protein
LITKTKPLIAVTLDLKSLGLNQREVRHDVGEHHYLSQDGKTYVLVCHPRHWRVAEKYLTSKGAVVAPPLGDPSQVGVKFSATVPADCAVAATDTTWAAATKISISFGWPAIDPAEL